MELPAFVPGDEGWVLLAAVYSQIELRVLAHFSGDARLCEAFARDEDIHAQGCQPGKRRPPRGGDIGNAPGGESRQFRGDFAAKAPPALPAVSASTRMRRRSSSTIILRGTLASREFLGQVLAGKCRKDGYVKTILGRRRAISGVRDRAGRQRNLAERTAINTVIQGSAASALIKRAMIAIHHRLRTEPPFGTNAVADPR